MAVAYQAVPREAVTQATSAINVIQRIAGSVGTALLAVVLQRSIAASLPGHTGGIGALAALSQQGRPQVAAALAQAFGMAFRVGVALAATALLPALLPALLLPRIRGSCAHQAAPAEQA